MDKNLFFIMIALCSIIVLGKSLSFTEKQEKMRACSILARDRLFKDKDYFSYVSSFVDPNSEENDRIQHLLSILMLSCFKNLSHKDSGSIIIAAEDNKLNSMSNEYKAVLALEQWESIYSSNDESLIKEEMTKYHSVISELRQIQQAMQKENSKDSDFDTEEIRKSELKNDNNDEDYYNQRTGGRPDMTIFGVDISKLPDNTKMIIGISLLVFLLGIFIFYAKKAIGELPATKLKVSKKKKKEE